MNASGKVTLGLAAIALVAIATLCWDWSTEPAAQGPESTPAAKPAPRVTTKVATDGTAQPIERTNASTPSPDEASDAETAAPLRQGRVIDMHGVGIAGVALSIDNRSANASASVDLSSSASGGFEFSPAVAASKIVSSDARWATVLAGSTRVPEAQLSTVIVAPRLELAGRIVDSEGKPLPDATIKVRLPAQLGADLGILLDYSVHVHWQATSSEHGRFVLQDVPAVAHAEVSVTLGGYLPRFVKLPPASTELLKVVLDRPAVGPDVVKGVVVDASGALVAGARVSAGAEVSRTDDLGEFTIDLSSNDAFDRIFAIAPGMQPAVLKAEPKNTGKPKWPTRVRLQLGPPPLSITGQVIDKERKPIEGAKVWIADPMVVGKRGELLAETILGRKDQPFWAFVLTDSSGMFRIDGLLDRAYQVRAIKPSTLQGVTKDEVQAGSSNVQLLLDAPTHPEFRGRVLAGDGTPIAGVNVKLTRMALAVTIPAEGNGSRYEWTGTPAIKTNQAGEFAFQNVPTEGIEVNATGESILFAWNTIKPDSDPMNFVVKANRRMHVQVELAAPTDRADKFKIFKATGRHMLLVVMRGGSRNQSFESKLIDGRSVVLTIGEGAETVVFYKEGKEVGRMPVQMQFGQVNTIRF